MPAKRNKYDIKIIKEMRTKGYSMRRVARENDWPEIALQAWIHRNYHELIDYKPKK